MRCRCGPGVVSGLSPLTTTAASSATRSTNTGSATICASASPRPGQAASPDGGTRSRCPASRASDAPSRSSRSARTCRRRIRRGRARPPQSSPPAALLRDQGRQRVRSRARTRHPGSDHRQAAHPLEVDVLRVRLPPRRRRVDAVALGSAQLVHEHPRLLLEQPGPLPQVRSEPCLVERQSLGFAGHRPPILTRPALIPPAPADNIRL